MSLSKELDSFIMVEQIKSMHRASHNSIEMSFGSEKKAQPSKKASKQRYSLRHSFKK